MQQVAEQLTSVGVNISKIALNGSVASHIVNDNNNNNNLAFNDIDLVFHLDDLATDEKQFHTIRSIVLQLFNKMANLEVPFSNSSVFYSPPSPSPSPSPPSHSPLSSPSSSPPPSNNSSSQTNTAAAAAAGGGGGPTGPTGPAVVENGSTSSNSFDNGGDVFFQYPSSHLSTGYTSLNYLSKTVRVWNDYDRWLLLSFGANPCKIDVMFVSRMSRSYQFSIDSFQIDLQPLVNQWPMLQQSATREKFVKIFKQHQVEVVSEFGNFELALDHLKRKVIATENAETIRGGGLLRYCELISKGYKTENKSGQVYDASLEQTICTRLVGLMVLWLNSI